MYYIVNAAERQVGALINTPNLVQVEQLLQHQLNKSIAKVELGTPEKLNKLRTIA
jgi:hypothetical protein